MEEIEVKFLNVDKAAMESKLAALGAEKIGSWLYKRQVFDYPDLRLDNNGAWVRLRMEGEKAMLAYKERLGKNSDGRGNDAGMYEVEVEVSDFDKTAKLLRKVGLADKFYFENRRTRYILDEIEFDIDEWPLLKPYLEIEAKSWAEVDRAIDLLKLDKVEAKKFSTTQIYELAGIQDKDYIRLTFNEAIKRGAGGLPKS